MFKREVIRLIIFIISFLILLVFFYSCLKVSSKCSREEERRDFYKVIGRDIQRKKKE